MLTNYASTLSYRVQPNNTDEELMAHVTTSPQAFHELFERYRIPLYRYFAVHTKGDLHGALGMTAQVFWAFLRQYRTYRGEGVAPWMFGIAWDVLNGYYNRRERTESGSAVSHRRLHDADLQNIMKILGSLPFYPRETLYLRFFAGLPPRDIAILMDRLEVEIKSLVYQGLLAFDSQFDASQNSATSGREKSGALADSYNHYLAAVQAGTTPMHSVPVNAIRATNRLKLLLDAFVQSPDTWRQLENRLVQSPLADRSWSARL